MQKLPDVYELILESLLDVSLNLQYSLAENVCDFDLC